MDHSTIASPARKPALPEHSMIVSMLRMIVQPLSTMARIHAKYGDLALGTVFKKKILFVRAPEYIEQIFNLEGKGLLNRDFMYDAKQALFGNGLINSESEVWSKQRRLMQPMFTKDAVKTWEQLIIAEAAAAAERVKLAAGGDVDLSAELRGLIQRIFLQVLLGKSVDQLSNGAQLINVIDVLSRELPLQLGVHLIFGQRLKRWIPLRSKNYRAAVEYLKTFLYAEIEQKRANPGQDLISLLLQAQDRSTGYTMPNDLLRDESVTLFFAGQETTINTLLWFFYLTGKHPAVREKIAAEIAGLPDEPLQAGHLAQLSYTKAALNETLRLYPPTSALTTQALADIELGDYAIAKDTILLLTMHATHHNPRLWPRPDEFDPDRFLDDSAAKRHKFAFFPFGGGLHNCIGKHFAELEMLLIIASFFRAFRFETDITLKEAFSVTLKPDGPVVGRVSADSPSAGQRNPNSAR
ncbi:MULTISPECIES: cytochrome P450 [Methylomonas]|uniref:Cytochrome P450 n=1 Tax=Methylomonas koyamae TaxID=702114 RepID=A0A177NVT6_9GAMM|nr:cytochrome P450 [Methylomonas koyamae]OAI22041.1 cytochrome P450 [Methylomonas koyamae]